MIKVFSPSYEGKVDLKDESLLDLYKGLGNTHAPKLIQVGGPLGSLYSGYDINIQISQLHLIENHISYFSEICVVDFMKFMLRFAMRELNLISDYLLEVYDLIDLMVTGQMTPLKYDYFKSLLDLHVQTRGEKLVQKNLIYINQHFNEEVLEHVNGYCRMSICRGLFDAQCINACPAHIHIPGFVALMKAGRTDQAYQLMRQENPLSSVCGAVCARPCEERCRRGEITSTVGVRALQRFIALDALKNFDQEICLQDNGHSVAIVGGGPAGLTAAYFLRRTGYRVTLYEKEAYAGGVLAFGVPSYRLPKHLIDEEIKTIQDLGVDIKTKVHVDKEKYIEIKKQYDRLILATGTAIGRRLSIDHKHVMTGIEYLKSVRLKNQGLEGRVAVVGGGDVAMDCARTAIRQGCQVAIISLESFEDMPASDEEKEQGKAEGIKFLSSYAVECADGEKLDLKPCLSVYDEAGVFKPQFASVNQTLEFDHVICAIGQEADKTYIDVIDENVYMCGDMIKPTIVIDAIAQGKRVAEKIHKSFGYSKLFLGDPIEIPEKILNIRTFDDDLKLETLQSAEHRIYSFEEVSSPYTFEDAVYEANRCMRCDRNSKTSLRLGREGR